MSRPLRRAATLRRVRRRSPLSFEILQKRGVLACVFTRECEGDAVFVVFDVEWPGGHSATGAGQENNR